MNCIIGLFFLNLITSIPVNEELLNGFKEGEAMENWANRIIQFEKPPAVILNEVGDNIIRLIGDRFSNIDPIGQTVLCISMVSAIGLSHKKCPIPIELENAELKPAILSLASFYAKKIQASIKDGTYSKIIQGDEGRFLNLAIGTLSNARLYYQLTHWRGERLYNLIRSTNFEKNPPSPEPEIPAQNTVPEPRILGDLNYAQVVQYVHQKCEDCRGKTMEESLEYIKVLIDRDGRNWYKTHCSSGWFSFLESGRPSDQAFETFPLDFNYETVQQHLFGFGNPPDPHSQHAVHVAHGLHRILENYHRNQMLNFRGRH